VSQEHYKELYGFDEESEVWMFEHFVEHSTETRGLVLTEKRNMQFFLCFASGRRLQVGVAEDIGVQRTTVCKTITYVLTIIIQREVNGTVGME
jgi:hypothetical protein